MSDEVRRSFNNTEIRKVHNFIEHCLTKYMTKKDAQNTLLKEQIPPRLTEVVWKTMEQENEEFFNEYYKRVAVIEIVERFNRLLQQQAVLMGHPAASGDGPMLPSIVEKVLDEVMNRIFTEEGIQKVQNFIELCLTKCMTKKEAGHTLFAEHQIEPLLTEIVWQLLEQENQEFFKGYYERLAEKDKLEGFNRLIEEQFQKAAAWRLKDLCQRLRMQCPNSVGPLGLKSSLVKALSNAGGKFTVDC